MVRVIDIGEVLSDGESVFVIRLCDGIESAKTNEIRLSYLARARRRLPEIKNEFYEKMLRSAIEKYSVC